MEVRRLEGSFNSMAGWFKYAYLLFVHLQTTGYLKSFVRKTLFIIQEYHIYIFKYERNNFGDSPVLYSHSNFIVLLIIFNGIGKSSSFLLIGIIFFLIVILQGLFEASVVLLLYKPYTRTISIITLKEKKKPSGVWQIYVNGKVFLSYILNCYINIFMLDNEGLYGKSST